MHEYHSVSPLPDGCAEHVARAHRTLAHRTLGDPFGPQEPPAHVEEHHVELLDRGVGEGAHGVVFVHNHPSGDPSPSAEDGDLTERLRAAAELVGVVARDHVIIGGEGYFSFVEAGRWRR